MFSYNANGQPKKKCKNCNVNLQETEIQMNEHQNIDIVKSAAALIKKSRNNDKKNDKN